VLDFVKKDGRFLPFIFISVEEAGEVGEEEAMNLN